MWDSVPTNFIPHGYCPLRQLPGYPAIPIIAMTASAYAEDKALCLGAGMNDFLVKPFSPDMLFTTLLRALSRRDD